MPKRQIPYVGVAPPVDRIEPGTLLRVSLARWWRPDDDPTIGERCYLQLSGWYRQYLTPVPPVLADDLPF